MAVSVSGAKMRPGTLSAYLRLTRIVLPLLHWLERRLNPDTDTSSPTALAE